MSTATSVDMLKAIRSRLLTFSTGALATALGTASGAGSDGKLYIDQAPDDVTYPYGTLRVVDRRSEGDDGGFARRLEVEIHLYHRPRNTASTLKAMADLCERALRAWVDVSSGVIVSRLGIARGSLTYEEPADRELILERLVVPFYVHETLHTQDSA